MVYRLTMLTIIAAAGGVFAAAALHAVSQVEPAPAPVAMAAHPAEPEPQPDDYLSRIRERDLFGVLRDAIPAPPTVSTALTVQGTVVTKPAHSSAAFVRAPGSSTSVVAVVGQRVGDAEVLEIRSDGIRVRDGRGVEAWIGLRDAEASTPTAAPAQRMSLTRADVDRLLVEVPTGGTRASPHRGPNGEIDGYRISSIRRGTALDKLGLRNGDVLTSVNGRPLDSVESVARLVTELRDSREITLDVRRRNKEEQIVYDITP